MTFATLRELHALIGTAIDDIERAYLNASPNSAPPEHSQQSPPPPIPPLPPLSTSPSPCSSPSHYSPVSEYSEEDPNDGDISALPTPVSVTFAIPPVKKKRPTRSRAYTLPPISPTTDIPPLWAPPKSILREPPTEPPLDFPDLDLPYFPTPLRKPADQFSSDSNVPSVQQRAEQRTRDRNTKAEDLTTDVDVVNAANKIIAACTQLSASLQKPFLTICDAAMGYHLPSCLRFLEAAHIVEILRDAGPQGMHVKEISLRITELSSKFSSNPTVPKSLDPALLSHIMRLLATHHITRELRPDVFTNNRISSLIDTGKQVEDLFQTPDAKYEGTNGVAAFIGLCGDECFKASAYLTDCYLTSTANSLPPTQLATPPSSSPILSPTHSPMTFSSGSPPDRIDEPATPKQNQGLRSAFDAYNQRTPTTPLSPSVPLASSSGAQARGLRKKISMSFLSNSPAPSSSVTEHTSTIPSSPVTTKSPGLLKRMGSRPLLGPAFSLAGMKDSGAKMGKKTSVGSFTSSDGRGSGNNGGLGSTPGTPAQVYPLAPANSPASFGNMSPYPSRKPSLASLYSPPSPTSSSPPPVPPLPSSSKIGHFASSSSLDLLSSPAIAVGRVEKGPPKRMSSRSSLLSGSGLGSVPPSPTVATAPVTTRRGHHRNTSSLSPIPDASAPSRSAAMRKSPPFLDSDAVPVVNSTPSTVPRITPAHPMYAPFNVAFQTDRPYFEWLEGEGNSGRLKRFGKAMTGTGNWDGAAIIDSFAWGDLPTGSIVVDVGGGVGSTSMLLANTFKHLRFVVQDRAPVAQMGAKAWKERYPEMLEDGTTTFQGHDFFTPQPPLPEPKSTIPPLPRTKATYGAGSFDGGTPSPPMERASSDGVPSSDRGLCAFPSSTFLPPVTKTPIYASVFLLRVITHDWPDAHVTRILLHLRQAAGPDTKLLLADYILPLACVDEDIDATPHGDQSKKEMLPGQVRTLAPEGSSLLPNLGKANANAYWLDLTMRVMFNAQERTLRELTALTLTAGWKVVQVTRAEGTLFGNVVAVPIDIPHESLKLLEPNSIEGEGFSGVNSGMGDTTGQSELYSPTMGDTFFSRVDLPSEETIVKSRVRISLLGRNRKKSTTSNSSSPFGGLGLGLGGLGFGGRKKKNGGRERAQTLTSSSSGPIVTGHHHPLPPLPLLPTRLQVRQGVDERLMSAGIGQGQDQVGGTRSGMGMGNSREASVVFPRREVHREVVDSGGNGEAAVGIGMGVGREGEGSPVGRQGKVEGKEGKKGWKTLKRMLSKPQMNSHAHAQGGGCEGGLEKGGEGSTGWVR